MIGLSIEDSGARTEFVTGAVRDIQEGKGRMDLLPLMVIASLFPEHHKDFFIGLDTFIHTGDKNCLFVSLHCAIDTLFLGDIPTATLEASIHFEEGIKKYGERNWEKGIPLQAFVNSALRHYVKCVRLDKNERHDRAVIWNLLCGIATCSMHPELNEYAKGESK